MGTASEAPRPLISAPDLTRSGSAAVWQRMDELGDIAAVLAVADREAKAQVYTDLGLLLVLDPQRRRGAVTAARVGQSVSERRVPPHLHP